MVWTLCLLHKIRLWQARRSLRRRCCTLASFAECRSKPLFKASSICSCLTKSNEDGHESRHVDELGGRRETADCALRHSCSGRGYSRPPYSSQCACTCIGMHAESTAVLMICHIVLPSLLRTADCFLLSFPTSPMSSFGLTRSVVPGRMPRQDCKIGRCLRTTIGRSGCDHWQWTASMQLKEIKVSSARRRQICSLTPSFPVWSE